MSTAPPDPATVVLETHTPSKQERAKAAAGAQVQNDPEEEELLWYFAIGSMMNPISMRLRNLCPKQSRPAVLKGWRLVFRGPGGMGDLDPCEGAHFHGVLHQLTAKEFEHLDSIELIYRRTPVRVECYDGTTVEALAYKMDQTRIDMSQPDALPGERYLDIIIRGAEHFGVDPGYIQELRSIPTMPRKKVGEYRKIPTPPPVVISREELARGTGADPYDPAVPLLVSCNGKVLRWASGAPSNEQVAQAYRWSRTRYGGTEVCCAIAKTLYEPLYPIPNCFEDMSAECRAWGEELFYGFSTRYTGAGAPTTTQQQGEGKARVGHYEVIGWLEGYEPEELKRK